ncbi:hypothetical protein MO973_03745, partial [Paenibacillus sp. TRM 82003]
MGLTSFLSRQAVRRCHVLLVEVPGHRRARVALERAIAARSWVLAASPAEADVLAVCGHPGPGVQDAVARLWDQLPGPRTRVDVVAPERADAALDAAAAALLDDDVHREDARTRSDAGAQDHEGVDHEGMDHEGVDHEGVDHEGVDHEGVDHEG